MKATNTSYRRDKQKTEKQKVKKGNSPDYIKEKYYKSDELIKMLALSKINAMNGISIANP